MKKILLFVIASLMFAASATAATIHPVKPVKKQEKDITIEDKNLPAPPPMPTSLDATVEARYTTDIELLELWFNREVGVVIVCLTDQMTGQTLLSYTCNSALEPQVCLNIALGTGFYSLQITGSDYEGYGSFDL